MERNRRRNKSGRKRKKCQKRMGRKATIKRRKNTKGGERKTRTDPVSFKTRKELAPTQLV